MNLEKTLSRRNFISAIGGLSALALLPNSSNAQEISDLIDALGRKRWDSLCNNCQANAEKSWYSRNEAGRQNIAQMYNDSNAYINRLTEKQKTSFVTQ